MRDYGYTPTIVPMLEKPEYQIYSGAMIPYGICTNWCFIDILYYLHQLQYPNGDAITR